MKISIELEMPTTRPDEVKLCEECSMKHSASDECWEGILPPGMLPTPNRDGKATGRELVDEGKSDDS